MPHPTLSRPESGRRPVAGVPDPGIGKERTGNPIERRSAAARIRSAPTIGFPERIGPHGAQPRPKWERTCRRIVPTDRSGTRPPRPKARPTRHRPGPDDPMATSRCATRPGPRRPGPGGDPAGPCAARRLRAYPPRASAGGRPGWVEDCPDAAIAPTPRPHSGPPAPHSNPIGHEPGPGSPHPPSCGGPGSRSPGRGCPARRSTAGHGSAPGNPVNQTGRPGIPCPSTRRPSHPGGAGATGPRSASRRLGQHVPGLNRISDCGLSMRLDPRPATPWHRTDPGSLPWPTAFGSGWGNPVRPPDRRGLWAAPATANGPDHRCLCRPPATTGLAPGRGRDGSTEPHSGR